MIINSGVTNIVGIPAFEMGSRYDTYDVVYYSGYDESSVSYPCTQAESGHYYYSGVAATTATASNRPAAGSTEWTTGFFFQPSYGATVDYQGLQYSAEYGDGYYTTINKSENAVRAEFNVTFAKRTDKETKALLHMLEDSFNKGNRPYGGYTGISWTPFPPYNHSGEFFVESFNHNYEAPDVNTVSTTFFNETASLTDWQQLYIPYSNTRGDYENDQTYSEHDITFLRKSDDFLDLVQAQSGWYYFTGVNEVVGTRENSPTGVDSLWVKDKFYFDVNQNLEIPQNPIFTKQNLKNDFAVRFSESLHKNLLNFSINFKGRSDKEAQTMVHFLEHHKGTSIFRFTVPAPYNFTDKVFLATSWNHTVHFKDNNDITVQLREFPIDYLSLSTEFLTLVTVVNRPVLETATGPGEGAPGSVSPSQRAEELDFVSNTGLDVYAITGQVLRTGFYLTNSGNSTLRTVADIESPWVEKGVDAQAPFEFISGTYSDPIITKPGRSNFIPFYFKGLGGNVTGWADGAGSHGGIYTAQLNLHSIAEDTGQPDPSGSIKLGITGHVTGWDVNPYKGDDGQTPMHPHKFLIQTGYYDSEGLPTHLLSWEHPATGHDLTRYSVQWTQDSSWADPTGITAATYDPAIEDYNLLTGFPIGLRELTTNPGPCRFPDPTDRGDAPPEMHTYLYTGLLVPPSLMGSAAIPKEYRNLPYPQNTGVRQNSFFNNNGLNFNEDYYYRMRSEYVPWGSVDPAYTENVTGSMYVYASGVNDLNSSAISAHVQTGLSTTSTDYTVARTAIPTPDKSAFQIDLEYDSTNINLSGLFRSELESRGFDTGTYADRFTGVQWILSQDYRVGSDGTEGDTAPYAGKALPAITTGDQLITGVVDVADAGAGADPNLQKPLAETPSVLIMGPNSAAVGAGGKGGDGGYTVVTNTIDAEDFSSYLSIGDTVDSQVGGDAGDGIYISHPDIAKFTIRKDYTAKIYGGGGGGGAGDRYLIEKIFSVAQSVRATSKDAQWDQSGDSRHNEGRRTYSDVEWENISPWRTPQLNPNSVDTLEVDPETGDIKFTDKTYSNLPEEKDIHHFRSNSFLGVHHGGAGGGGAGFRRVDGGKQWNPKDPEAVAEVWDWDPEDKADYTITASSCGGYELIGIGNIGKIFQKGADVHRFSYGGKGGNYGEFGAAGQTLNSNTSKAFQRWVPDDPTRGKPGGAGGMAIRIVADSTYTSDNFREKLLVITPAITKIDDIPGLVAHFDASSLVYRDDGSTAAEANAGTPNRYCFGTASQSGTTVTGVGTTWTPAMVGCGFTFRTGFNKNPGTVTRIITGFASTTELTVDSGTTVSLATRYVITGKQKVYKWEALNNPNIFLKQSVARSRPTLCDGDFYDNQIFDLYGVYAKMDHSYFNNKKYIYFHAGTYSYHFENEVVHNHFTFLEYLRLYNATADESFEGDIKVNNGGAPYPIDDYSSGGIEIDAPASYPVVVDTLIHFERGGVFKVTEELASGTTLKGNLSGNNLKDDERGFYRLSTLCSGFDIFYVMYPNDWLKGWMYRRRVDDLDQKYVMSVNAIATGDHTGVGVRMEIDPYIYHWDVIGSVQTRTGGTGPSDFPIIPSGSVVVFDNGGQFLISEPVELAGTYHSLGPSNEVIVKGTLKNVNVLAGENGLVAILFPDDYTYLDIRSKNAFMSRRNFGNFHTWREYVRLNQKYQTGWTRFSDPPSRRLKVSHERAKLRNSYYSIQLQDHTERKKQSSTGSYQKSKDRVIVSHGHTGGFITDSTGMGSVATPFRFQDWTNQGTVVPERSWVYNLGGEYKGDGHITMTPKNSGNKMSIPMGVFFNQKGYVAGYDFKTPEEKSYLSFNESGEVFIGASYTLTYNTDGDLNPSVEPVMSANTDNWGYLCTAASANTWSGFRGGIAAIVIFNRKLDTNESRVVMGHLWDKYINIKSQDGSTLNNMMKNRMIDESGIVGHVLFDD